MHQEQQKLQQNLWTLLIKKLLHNAKLKNYTLVFQLISFKWISPLRRTFLTCWKRHLFTALSVCFFQFVLITYSACLLLANKCNSFGVCLRRKILKRIYNNISVLSTIFFWVFWQTQCSRGCLKNAFVTNRFIH